MKRIPSIPLAALLACGIAVSSLLLFRMIAAEPVYELSQPVSVNAGGQSVQLPAGQVVGILGAPDAAGNVMIKVVLPNGSLSIAQVPATDIRQKAAVVIAPTPPPAVAAETPLPAAAPLPAPAAPSVPDATGTTSAAVPPAAAVATPPPASVPAAALPATSMGAPDFGPNVIVVDPSMSDIQSKIDGVSKFGQFDTKRCAILFKPGNYNINARVGFYMQVLGLGQNPDAVTLSGLSSTDKGNVTQTFWRAAENLAATKSYWAVSQGTSLRRIHAKGGLSIFDSGWASGGFDADCKIDGAVGAGGQQQWFSRNSTMSGWNGGVWNVVFVGCSGAPTKWPVNTVVPAAPLIAEKPYLFVDSGGNYYVMVPAVRAAAAGTDWAGGQTPGKPIPISNFYIAHAGKDNAASMNSALAAGRNLLLTPGIYHLESSINVTRPDTVVMGIGYATLIPDKGTPAIKIANVNGVKVGALLLEASTTNTPTLLQVGEPGDSASHAADPTVLYDIFARVGGAGPGSADCMVTINSNDVIGDNAWLWRADHGAGATWDGAKNKNGLIVNGNNVTYYGLAVEHTQEFQTLWNGNGGSVYFYQSEMPYDVPSGRKGFASYKVSSNVTSHQGWGIGIYSFNHEATIAEDAIEAPTQGTKFTHMVLFGNSKGGITHMINGTGAGNVGSSKAIDMTQWP